jgi:protein SMG7
MAAPANTVSATMSVPAAATAAAGATATEPTDPKMMFDQKWRLSGKLRVTIEKDLGKIQSAGPDVDAVMAGFNKVEERLAQYRLCSLQMIIMDIRAASVKERQVEQLLWQTHVNVTKVYRKVIGRLQGPNLVVSKRKVEKQYVGFLMTSLSFYRTYLQRFCGLYKFRELERVARKVKFDDLPGASVTPVKDTEKDTEPEILEQINASFHRTLIYLGDLSRYRTLVRSKDRSFDTALTYYALANEMIPESGVGYHQCAMIYSETKNHLEIVYNLYRCIACERPAPLARQNLEHEFRDILQPVGGGGAKDSHDAMVKWFVKLHANYYQGEEFTGRKELEDEVDHRLAMALKTGGEAGIDNILLKMVLTNITAYDAGQAAIKAEWTAEKSQTCQFVLQLNTRTIYTISRLLAKELEDYVQQKPLEVLEAASATGEESSSKFTPAFYRILPLFRVYMTWLLYYAKDLNDYRSYLEQHYVHMCKSLAHTLSLVFGLLSTMTLETSTTGWLFPEDEETIGMKCLNGPGLYDGCQLRVDGLGKKPKPPAHEVPNVDRTTDTAAYLRMVDTVLCGIRLDADTLLPIVYSDKFRVFSYDEGVKGQKAALSSPPAEMHASANTGAAASIASPNAPVAIPQEPAPVPSALIPTAVTDSEDFSDDNEFYQPAAQHSRASRQTTVAPGMAPPATVSEFPIENQLYQILNDFLVPPERSASQSNRHQEETSYGMGSRTADEVFGVAAAPTSPAPGSANSKTFPSLPWNYFVPTAPAESALRDKGAIRSPSHGWDSRPSSSGSPRNASFAAKESRVSPRNLARRSASHATSPYAYQGPQDWAAQTALANQALRERTLQTQNDQTRLDASTGRALHSKKSSSLASPSGVWQQSPSHIPATTGQPTTNLAFSSGGFSAVDSSLPPVNSPWGVPMAQVQAYEYQNAPSTGGSHSHPSVAYPGTQQPMPGSVYSPGLPLGFTAPHSMYSNGTGYELSSASAGDQGQGWGFAPEDFEKHAQANAWSNDYGPRSTGAQQTFDGSDPRAGGDTKIAPAMSTFPHPASGRGVSANWNTKPKPK